MANLTRRVAIERVDSAEAAADALATAARSGAAVVWVRNAVDDAIEGAELLRDRGLDPMLFHARYAMGDRLDREEAVLRRFGKRSAAAERRGGVLVATQVVEQSLDLDFDLMVGDLAPADLLIQHLVGQGDAVGTQPPVGEVKVHGVPVDDGGGDEAEAGGAEALVFEGAVAELSLAVEEHGAAQRVLASPLFSPAWLR